MNINNYNKYGPIILRISLSLVFLYFGINQLINPEAFIGWLPTEAKLIPIEPRTFIILNGGLEIFFGTMLAVGLYRKISALILGLHLLAITISIGFTEIGVRDFGLSLATLSIILIGYDPYSLDAKLINNSQDKALAQP